jgi:tetratricopeptide (TPR) repeat protein
VIAVEPEPEAQSVVESFLSAHAGDKSIWEIEGTAPTPSEHQENQQQEETDKAAFLLQIGVRALSGGNPASAAHRLHQCMAELNTQLENLEIDQETAINQEEQQNQVLQIYIIELLAKMGAVAGCLGDCFRALGDAPQAIREYTHSAELLERIASYSNPSTESKETLTTADTAATTTAAAKSLSVTVNKIGEIYHLQGDLEKALEKYEEALLLRQARLQQIQVDNEGSLGQHHCRVTSMSIEAVLDVVVSHIKVANVLESILDEKKSGEKQAGVSKVAQEEEEKEQQRRWRQHEEMAREMICDVEAWLKKEEEKSSTSGDIIAVVDDMKRKVDMLKSHLESFN